MGDELLLNFGAKFHRKSPWRSFYSLRSRRFFFLVPTTSKHLLRRLEFLTFMNEDVRPLQDALENLNHAQKTMCIKKDFNRDFVKTS